jgi:hypothetical protein
MNFLPGARMLPSSTVEGVDTGQICKILKPFDHLDCSNFKSMINSLIFFEFSHYPILKLHFPAQKVGLDPSHLRQCPFFALSISVCIEQFLIFFLNFVLKISFSLLLHAYIITCIYLVSFRYFHPIIIAPSPPNLASTEKKK